MNVQVPTKIKSQHSDPQNSPNEVRVAYPFFHEKRTKSAAGVPYMKKDGTLNPRYSATFMFPKLAADASQCPNYMFLWGLATEAAKKMWPQNVDAAGNWVWPQGAQFAVKDGDVPYTAKPKPGVIPPTAEQIAQKNAWRKGYWIVEAENFLDPGPRIAKVVNGQMTDLPAKILNGITLYKSGDFGFINLHAYAYQNETFGVNFGFDGFCFTREGDPIGASGPRSTAQMFGGLAPGGPGGQGAAPSLPLPVAPTAPSAIAGQVPTAMASVAPSSGMPPMPPMPPGVGAGLPPLPIPR